MTFVEDQAKAWSEIPQLTKLSDPIPETTNGPGATLAATEHLRAELPKLFASYNIKTMLDVGCGDWNWMQHVDLSGLDSYIGWDVDPGTIETNRDCFSRGSLDIRFECQNLLTATDIPTVDLILARHVLIHFPNRYTTHLLENFKTSGATYLLSSTWPGEDNSDDQPDGFAYRGYMERIVNLEGEPFNLPEPLDSIDEPPGPAGVLRYAHYLALFKLPPRSFHTRAHPATEGSDSISFMGALEDFKGRVDRARAAAEPDAELADTGAARLDKLRAVRDHLREVDEIAKNDDSMGTAWAVLGALKTAVYTMLQDAIGDTDEQ